MKRKILEILCMMHLNQQFAICKHQNMKSIHTYLFKLVQNNEAYGICIHTNIKSLIGEKNRVLYYITFHK